VSGYGADAQRGSCCSARILGEAERGNHRLEGEELEDGADRVALVEVALGDAQRFPQPPVPAVEDEEVLPRHRPPVEQAAEVLLPRDELGGGDAREGEHEREREGDPARAAQPARSRSTSPTCSRADTCG